MSVLEPGPCLKPSLRVSGRRDDSPGVCNGDGPRVGVVGSNSLASLNGTSYGANFLIVGGYGLMLNQLDEAE